MPTNAITANEYQEFTIKTAIYPGAGTGNKDELSYLALGLNGESGEVADKIKKYLRDGPLDTGGIVYELGDVCWYIARLSDALGYSFEDILAINKSKLLKRLDNGAIQGSGDYRGTAA